jgi:transcriptional regulator with XRE-family HTH domain
MVVAARAMVDHARSPLSAKLALVSGVMGRRTELQAQRRAIGLSQEALAHKIGVSVNSVRGWEAGTQAPYLKHRTPLAHHLGLSLGQLNRLLDPEAPISLNGDSLAVTAEWLSIFVRAEQNARTAKIFEAINMPGLLQTRAYATALEYTTHRTVTDTDVERWVEMRLARAAVLDRAAEPLQLEVRIPRPVLTDVVGSADVMVEQLDHLATMAERPNVDLRILAGQRMVSAPGSFTLLRTLPGADLVCLEWLRGFAYHEDPTVVQDFADLFDAISDVAMSPFESLNLIRKTREDHRR